VAGDNNRLCRSGREQRGQSQRSKTD
jgi:hypothetical protein